MTARSARLRTAIAVRRSKAKPELPKPAPMPLLDPGVGVISSTSPAPLIPTQWHLWEGTVYEYLTFWLKKAKYGTIKQTSYDTIERVVLAYIHPTIGDIPLLQLIPEDIQDLLTAMREEDGYSYSTVKKVYTCLNEALRYATVRKFIVENPMLLVEMPAEALFKTKEIGFFTVRECELIIEEAMRVYSTGRRVYAYGDAFVLLMLTGLRLGELIGLKPSDYDAANKMLKVRRTVHKVRKRDDEGNLLPGRELQVANTTKTYSGRRDIPLPELAVKSIERMMNDHPYSKHLVCNTKGAMATPEQIDRTFHYLLKNVGLERSGVHKLRHTYASILFSSRKVDIKTISRLMGHATPTITLNIYTHIADRIPHEAITPLDDLF